MQEIIHEIDSLSMVLSSDSDFNYSNVANSIIGLMMKNTDLSSLAGRIIKFLALPYPPFKRVACSYLTKYSADVSNLNVLSTNCFLKDFEDPNPYIRRLVIKTIVHIPCLQDFAFELLPIALCDVNLYVRGAATLSCSLVINDYNLESKQSIIDKLYHMIRDPEPSVVASSLIALDNILHSEGGIVINSRLSHYLINRISEFRDYNFVTICMVLTKFIPRSDEELFQFLNALDQSLLSSNPIIFLSAANLALFYISSMGKMFSSDIIVQILPQIEFLLHHSSDELLYEILDLMSGYVTHHEEAFCHLYKLLFCHFSDPIFIKIKKLQVIYKLKNSSNVKEIAEELLLHAYSNIREVSVQSIRSFINLINLYPVSMNLIQDFVHLMYIGYNNLNDDILTALCSIKLEGSQYENLVLMAISKNASKVFTVKGKLALLQLVASYGKNITNAPYIIEELLSDPLNICNEKIMLMMILSSTQLFFTRPSEMQFLLGHSLQLGMYSKNIMLKKQCIICNHMLNNFHLGKHILFNKEYKVSKS